MNITWFDKIRENRPNIKDITINNYVNVIYTLIDIGRGFNVSFKNKQFYNPKFSVLFINTAGIINDIKDLTIANSTKKLYIQTIMVLLGLEGLQYKTTIDIYNITLKELHLNIINNTSKSEKDTKNWTTMNKLINITINKEKEVYNTQIYSKSIPLKEHDYNLLRNYIICCLHTYHPPRRNIFRTVRLITEKEFIKLNDEDLGINYLIYDIDTIYFYLGNQKSNNNTQIHYISDKLKYILVRYITFLNLKNFDLLLHSRHNEITTSNYSKLLKQNLGVSSSLIRKIYSTESTSDAWDIIKNTAVSLGHTIQTQKQYYVKK